jgi:hypothetical protein
MFQRAAVFACLVLAACPIGIAVPLGNPGTEKIDKGLIGTWRSADADHELQVVRVAKRDKTSYDVEVLEKGEMFTAESTHFTAWVTQIEGQRFLYGKPEGSSEYFHYAYTIEGGEVVLSNVVLAVGGVDAATSTDAFRAEVVASMKLGKAIVDPVRFTRK